MKRYLTFILLMIVICLGSAADANNNGPLLLHRAVYCLFAKSFLRHTKAMDMRFGYLLDEISYPGEKVLYVVNYSRPSRPDGFVFTIFVTEHDGHQVFNIQNNARFILSKYDNKELSFPDPPLGGEWTQEHLLSAIRQINKNPRFTISTKNLLAFDFPVSCQAYTDPQTTPVGK